MLLVTAPARNSFFGGESTGLSCAQRIDMLVVRQTSANIAEVSDLDDKDVEVKDVDVDNAEGIARFTEITPYRSRRGRDLPESLP